MQLIAAAHGAADLASPAGRQEAARQRQAAALLRGMPLQDAVGVRPRHHLLAKGSSTLALLAALAVMGK